MLQYRLSAPEPSPKEAFQGVFDIAEGCINPFDIPEDRAHPNRFHSDIAEAGPLLARITEVQSLSY